MRRNSLLAWCLLLPASAQAAAIVHVKYPVYGCEKPAAVGVINNEADPRHADPAWLATMMGYAQCVRITPQSPWEKLGADQDGLTLLAYRGTLGQPGSFYVPTAALDAAADAANAPGAGAPQAAGQENASGPAAASPPSEPPGQAASAPVPPSASVPPSSGSAAAPAGDPQLAEVEAGVARIEPPESSGSLSVLAAIAALLIGGGAWLLWRRQRGLKRARLLDAIRLEVAANAQALRAKRVQTVQADEYGTADYSQWNAAKDYYLNTRIDPIVAAHGYKRLPSGYDADVDALIEKASTAAAS